MREEELFSVVGICPEKINHEAPKAYVGSSRYMLPVSRAQKARLRQIPLPSLVLLGLIMMGCLFAEFLAAKDPSYLDLMNCTHAPDSEFLFGTDTLGRDLFSCIWFGGRISLFIGLAATAVSVVIAVLYGSISGLAPVWLDTLLMRIAEIFLSIPTLLVIIFLQAVLGSPTVFSIAFVVGITSWCSMAKIIRTEVRQLRSSEYMLASKCMGGSFFHILTRHLAPNFVSSIMFMVVMNIRSAIVSESTLSFMGMGLPLEVISWGSMLSLAEKALMTGAWWVIVIPGTFLIALLMCMTNIGNWLRKQVNQKESYL